MTEAALTGFSPKQLTAVNWWRNEAFQDCDAIICDGAIRSGKTTALSLGFVIWACARFSGMNFALCGKTATSLRRNLVTPLTETLRLLGFGIRDRISRGMLEITFFGHTNRFYLFGGRDESSAALIQGITLAGVLLDEVALMPRSFVEQALARCSVRGAKFWFSCNPAAPSHWFYREWICRRAEKHALYLHFTMADNPGLSGSVRRRYERLYTGAFYDRFVRGVWTAAQGLVYPMFCPERHIRTPPEPPERFVISCDYGTLNPASFGLWGLCRGRWYRIAESYHDARKTGEIRTDEEHYAALEALAGKRKIDEVIVDPSAASFIACIRRHGRFRATPAKNDVLAGIHRVADALQNDEIAFAPECTDTVREFGLYAWEEQPGADKPRKEHDHAMDDVRYFVMGVLDRPEDPFFAVSVRR